MAKIIALANQKGGVAKTTTAQNLGVALAERGQRVLLVDLDSQASLTIAVGLEPLDHVDACILQVLAKDGARERLTVRECMVDTPDGHMKIVPSVIDLANLEWQMFTRINRETILGRALEAEKDDFDFVLLDCPPSLGILTLNALACADGVLVPSTTEYLSYRGLTNLEDTIADVKALINPGLETLGTVATKHERTTRNRQVLELMLGRGDCLAVIKKRTEALAGIYDGRSVVDQAPYSDLTFAYKRLAEMICTGKTEPLTAWSW